VAVLGFAGLGVSPVSGVSSLIMHRAVQARWRRRVARITGRRW
jgi:hypothetical protein